MWGLVLLIAAVLAAVIVLALRSRASQEREREARRKRYAVPETNQRVPMAPEREAVPPPRAPEVAAFLAGNQPAEAAPEGIDSWFVEQTEIAPDSPVVEGRLVATPDGEMILTTPPFALRESLLTRREAAYARAIRKRLGRGLAVCPKVRLESLVTPTPPDQRDPEDWRTWRRRVRMRAVDLVIVKSRTWRPVLAIEIDRPAGSAVRVGGAGGDRLIDEVLTHIGLPLVRCTGDVNSDWGMIEPYVGAARGSPSAQGTK